MAKKVAVIGSSGGNLYNQGGSDVSAMFKEIFTQTESAGIEVAYVQFVGASGSMDNVSKESPATLYLLQDGSLMAAAEGTLNEINAIANDSDAKLAQLIEAGEIDGIMQMSADPKGTNNKALTAAAAKKIPVAGTGGTSMADTGKLGCRIVSQSGTTGTTNRTRAVAFTTALSKEWGLKYMPVIGNTGAKAAAKVEGNVWKRINFRGIMMTSMPAFICMAILLALGQIRGLDDFLMNHGLTALGGDDGIANGLIGALPIVVAAIASMQVSGFAEVGVVAGVITGFMSKGGGILGGLATGILCGILVYYISMWCFNHKVPGTTTNIAAGGLAGLVAGLIGLFIVAPIALWIGNGIRGLIDACISFSPIAAGVVAGLLIWPAIIGGVYHAAILPIILLEMEVAGSSFLGSIDMCGLVMVSAGITLANIVFPREQADRVVALPGFAINLGFGTFVEAAYPFMFADKLVFAGALIASAVSGAFVGIWDVRGTAYVPVFTAPMVANPGKGFYFVVCMVIAMAAAFVITAMANLAHRKKAAA